MASTTDAGPADRPGRIGWHLGRARERAGLTLDGASAASGIALEELDALESGWRELAPGEADRLAHAYGCSREELVPPRTPVVVDAGSRVIGIGPRRASFGEQRDDALATYLSMIYEARGASRGARIPLRDEDLDVLAGLVGEDPDEVESRLIELMGCTEEEARTLRALLFRRRFLATAASVVLGLSLTAAIAEHAQGPAVDGFAVASPNTLDLHDPSSGSQAAPDIGEVGPAQTIFAQPDGAGEAPRADAAATAPNGPVLPVEETVPVVDGGHSTPPVDGGHSTPPVDAPGAGDVDVVDAPVADVDDAEGTDDEVDGPRGGGSRRGDSDGDDGNVAPPFVDDGAGDGLEQPGDDDAAVDLPADGDGAGGDVGDDGGDQEAGDGDGDGAGGDVVDGGGDTGDVIEDGGGDVVDDGPGNNGVGNGAENGNGNAGDSGNASDGNGNAGDTGNNGNGGGVVDVTPPGSDEDGDGDSGEDEVDGPGNNGVGKGVENGNGNAGNSGNDDDTDVGAGSNAGGGAGSGGGSSNAGGKSK